MAGAAAVALAVAGWGCIFFVNDDPSKLGSTCHFQGESTACGQCVATTCAKQLDACCASSSCASSLSSLDQCAADADVVACGQLTTLAPDLGSCIESACAACGGSDAGVEAAAGSTNCYKSGDSCFCSAGQQHANGFVCNTGTLPGPGLCCADYGWPQATASQCSCEPFSCTQESGGGICSLGVDSTLTTSWSGTGCCSLGTTCLCDDSTSSCPGSETQVDTCTVAAIGCGSSQVQVTSCSF
jgi:hypothetical protein